MNVVEDTSGELMRVMLGHLLMKISKELGITIHQFSTANISSIYSRRYRAGDWTYFINDRSELTIQRWNGPIDHVGSRPLNLPFDDWTPYEESAFYERLRDSVIKLRGRPHAA